MSQLSQRSIDRLRTVVEDYFRTAEFSETKGGSTPPARDIYIKITSSSSISSNLWEYTVSVYTTPYAATALATNKKARNLREIGNTSTAAEGYSLSPSSTTCGDITAVEPAPTGSWHRAIDFLYTGSQWYFLFEYQNHPVVVGA